MGWYACTYTPERIIELVGPMAEADARSTAAKLRESAIRRTTPGTTARRFGYVEAAADGSIDREKITQVVGLGDTIAIGLVADATLAHPECGEVTIVPAEFDPLEDDEQ